MTPDIYSKIINSSIDTHTPIHWPRFKLGSRQITSRGKIETPWKYHQGNAGSYAEQWPQLSMPKSQLQLLIPVTVRAQLWFPLPVRSHGAKVPQANKDLAQEELKACPIMLKTRTSQVTLPSSRLWHQGRTSWEIWYKDVRKIVSHTFKNYNLWSGYNRKPGHHQ